MTTDRVFAAFAKDGRHGLGLGEVPADGFCISAFVVVSDSSRPGTVLLGRLNPDAPWDHLGALDRERTSVHSKGWMLPSSHLMYGESPAQAAERILKEQLGVEGVVLGAPDVFSEVYGPKRHPEKKGHWDLEFIFRVAVAPSLVDLQHPAWQTLRFLDARTLDPAEVARSHEDIISRAL